MNTLWPFGVKFCVPTRSPFRLLYRWLMPASPYNEMNRLMYKYGHGNDFPETGKDRYLKHNDHVRRTVKKENLLEFDMKQGWEPLCEFLEKAVPDKPFPRSNDTLTFNQKWGPAIAMLDGLVMAKLVSIAAIVGLSGLVYLNT